MSENSYGSLKPQHDNVGFSHGHISHMGDYYKNHPNMKVFCTPYLTWHVGYTESTRPVGKIMHYTSSRERATRQETTIDGMVTVPPDK